MYKFGLVSIMLTLMFASGAQALVVSSGGNPVNCSLLTRTGVLRLGVTSPIVYVVQQMLNDDLDTQIAVGGAGSPGKETVKYGSLTAKAVHKFQIKYKDEVLTPAGLSRSTGVVGALTKKKLYELCSHTEEPQTLDALIEKSQDVKDVGGVSKESGVTNGTSSKTIDGKFARYSSTTTNQSRISVGTSSASTTSRLVSVESGLLPVTVIASLQNGQYPYGPVLPIQIHTKERDAIVGVFVDGKRVASIPTNKFVQGLFVFNWETVTTVPGSHVVIVALSKKDAVRLSSPLAVSLVRFGGGGGSSGGVSSGTNGVCGASNGGLFSVAPAALLCNVGSPSAVSLQSTQWGWSCSGVTGGVQASCSASFASTSTQSTTMYQFVSDEYDNLAKNYIGMNLWFSNDYDGTLSFVDLMQQARFWQDVAWSPAQPPLDAYGWPMADASTVIFTGPPSEVNGTYKMKFNGKADISFLFANNGVVTNKTYNTGSNETTADITYTVTSTSSIGLIMRNTQRTAESATGTGFTNLRLYRPGYPSDGSVVFTSPFVDALKKTNVIRMMDWTDTNQNLLVNWADRITPLHFHKTGPGTSGVTFNVSGSLLGVPIEYQIALCNEVQSDCWFNIPALASDEYITKLALAVKYGTDGTNPYSSTQVNPVHPPLNSNLKIYTEYCNEIWNSAGGFYCMGAIRNIIDVLPTDHPVNTPAESNYYYKVWKYQAYRITAVSDIFRSIFGDGLMMTRIRPVIMNQLGDGLTSLSSPLLWLDAYGKRQTPVRTVDSYIYGAGGSGYYGSNNTISTQDRGNADIFYANGNYPNSSLATGVSADAMWAYNFGAKRIAYEGGPSLDNYTATQANSINFDPRMQDMITKTHDIWSNSAGDLLVYYVLRGPSSWEFTNNIANSSSPKLLGIDELRARPRAAVTIGTDLPGEIIATDASSRLIRTGFHYTTTCSGLSCNGGNDTGEFVAIAGRSTSTFAGVLYVKALSNGATTMKVYINGKEQGIVSISGNGALQDSNSIPVSIPAGLVVVRLEVTSGSMNLRSVVVQ